MASVPPTASLATQASWSRRADSSVWLPSRNSSASGVDHSGASTSDRVTTAITTSSAPAAAMVRRKDGRVSILPTSGSISEGSWYSQPGWCSSDPRWWSTVTTERPVSRAAAARYSADFPIQLPTSSSGPGTATARAASYRARPSSGGMNPGAAAAAASRSEVTGAASPARVSPRVPGAGRLRPGHRRLPLPDGPQPLTAALGLPLLLGQLRRGPGRGRRRRRGDQRTDQGRHRYRQHQREAAHQRADDLLAHLAAGQHRPERPLVDLEEQQQRQR